MLSLAMLVLLLPQAAPEAGPQETTPPQPAVTYDQGPLRLTLVQMRESRMKVLDPNIRPGAESELRMQFRVEGERLVEVARFGNFVLTEIADDTGRSLLRDDNETDTRFTRANTISPERLRDNGLLFIARAKEAARAARTIDRIRASVRLILATESEKVTIVNPAQYYGRSIDDPRLAELGIDIRVMPLDLFTQQLPPDRALVLRFAAHEESIKSVTWFDGWMRPVFVRDSPVSSRDGEACSLYYFDPSTFNNELQLVLEVLPRIDDVQVTYEGDGIELP